MESLPKDDEATIMAIIQEYFPQEVLEQQNYIRTNLLLLSENTQRDMQQQRTVFVAILVATCRNTADTALKAGQLWDKVFGLEEQPAHPVRHSLAGPLFGVGNTTRTSSADLLRFTVRVEELLRWRTDEELQKKYFAPCMAVVQSSGTGKTKLLFDYRSWCDKQEAMSNRKVFFVSCLSHDQVKLDDIDDDKDAMDAEYDFYLHDLRDNSPSKENRENFIRQLASPIQNLQQNIKDVVLLLDEAQVISSTRATARPEERPFYLRCLLWAIKASSRELTEGGRNVVVVLTGTSQSLADVFPAKESSETTKFSREPSPTTNRFLGTGNSSFVPFIELYTTGSLAGRISYNASATEYDIAIQYGRPLFARMITAGVDIKGKPGLSTVPFKQPLNNDHHAAILSRMLLSLEGAEWHKSEMACLSILATRVQLGSTFTNVTSELVEKGYANLVYVDEETASSSLSSSTSTGRSSRFSYWPDPVCARLAMCMMVPGYQIEGKRQGLVTSVHLGHPGDFNFQAISHKDLATTLANIYSNGLCYAPRGDLGEVVSVLYMLMCGDMLRFRHDQEMKTFSISVNEWYEMMVSQDCMVDVGDDDAQPMTGNDDDNDMTSIYSSETKHDETVEGSVEPMETDIVPYSMPTISFIQACRNDLRCSLKYMLDNEQFLQQLYKSGVMVYPHEGAKALDCFTGCKLTATTTGQHIFVPLGVSIKTRGKFGEKEQKAALESAMKMFPKQKGICILFLCDLGDTIPIFHPKQPTRILRSDRANHSVTLYQSMTADFTHSSKMVVARIVKMPKEDRFGLTHVVHNATRLGSPEAELFASHTFWTALETKRNDWTKTRGVAHRTMGQSSPASGLGDFLKEFLEPEK